MTGEHLINWHINKFQFSLSQEDRRNITNLYNLLTIAELEKKHPNIPFLTVINNILPGKVQVHASQEVLVGVPEYLTALERLVTSTPPR